MFNCWIANLCAKMQCLVNDEVPLKTNVQSLDDKLCGKMQCLAADAVLLVNHCLGLQVQRGKKKEDRRKKTQKEERGQKKIEEAD